LHNTLACQSSDIKAKEASSNSLSTHLKVPIPQFNSIRYNQTKSISALTPLPHQTTTTMSKIFTIFGATGNQGGSVLRAVLAHPTLSKTYKLRAVTRDVNKPSSTALAAKGVEVVAADMNDASSIKKAVEGSSVVFGVTNCKFPLASLFANQISF
jgi:hypothetical protein